MSDAPSDWTDRAAELRLAFDRSFAEHPRLDTSPQESLLAIRLGSVGHAIRLSEVARLLSGKAITRIPCPIATLIGIAGFRGTILPVYSLSALLGHPSPAAPTWLAIAAGAPVAFAFEAFDGHLRVPRDDIVSRSTKDVTSKYIGQFVIAAELVRPIVNLSSVLDEIRDLVAKANAGEER